MFNSRLPEILRRWTAGPPSRPGLDPQSTPPERRTAPRIVAQFEAIIRVKDDAPFLALQGLDFSRYGAMVLAPEPIPPGAVVFFHSTSHKLMGFATVRHCASFARGKKFRVGLEFPLELMYAGVGVWDTSRVSQHAG